MRGLGMSYTILCSVCRREFETAEPEFSIPGGSTVVAPRHDHPEGSGIPCPGSEGTAFGTGERAR